MRYDEVSRDTDVECIEAVLEDHPEVRVLWGRPHVVEVGGVKPVLHVTVEAVVEAQIRRRDPPEAEEAFRRLLGMGFGRHAARGAIANLFLVHVFPALKQGKPFDRESYARQLKMLGAVDVRKVGRNDACPCGSGKKFKKCCLGGRCAGAGPLGGVDAAWRRQVRSLAGCGVLAGRRGSVSDGEPGGDCRGAGGGW